MWSSCDKGVFLNQGHLEAQHRLFRRADSTRKKIGIGVGLFPVEEGWFLVDTVACIQKKHCKLQEAAAPVRTVVGEAFGIVIEMLGVVLRWRGQADIFQPLSSFTISNNCSMKSD